MSILAIIYYIYIYIYIYLYIHIYIYIFGTTKITNKSKIKWIHATWFFPSCEGTRSNWKWSVRSACSNWCKLGAQCPNSFGKYRRELRCRTWWSRQCVQAKNAHTRPVSRKWKLNYFTSVFSKCLGTKDERKASIKRPPQTNHSNNGWDAVL